MKYRSLESMIRDVVAKRNEKSTYTSLEHAIRNVVAEAKKPPYEIDPNDQITIGSYKTKNFDFEPEAQMAFTKRLPKTADVNKAEKSAIMHDHFFGLMKLYRLQGGTSNDSLRMAKTLVQRINMLGQQMNTDHSYLDKHLEQISSGLGKEKDASQTAPKEPTGEIGKDYDIDQKDFHVSRSAKMQKKMKFTDDD